MKYYEIAYISWATKKYSIQRVHADTEELAVMKVFEAEGFAFKNRLISIKEVEE